MAKTRKFAAYRRLDARPYTRVSKFRKLSFVKTRPQSNLVKFEMGDATKEFEHKMLLGTKTPIQIRHNALEAARQTCNRLLERTLGKGNYHLKLAVYPHHILRENPLASGAGADRMSTGMKNSFGKNISVAARLKKGQSIFTLRIAKEHLATGKLAFQRASKKLPCSCIIQVE